MTSLCYSVRSVCVYVCPVLIYFYISNSQHNPIGGWVMRGRVLAYFTSFYHSANFCCLKDCVCSSFHYALCKTALIFMLRTSVIVTVSKIPAMPVETTDLLTFSFG